MLLLLACSCGPRTSGSAVDSPPDWAPETRGADTLVQVPRVVVDDLRVEGATASEWVHRKKGADPGASWQLVEVPSAVEYAIDARVRLVDCAPTWESGDGTAFGWIGLRTSEGFAGVMLQEGFRVRAWSDEPYGPGTGAVSVDDGVWMDLRLTNEVGRVSFWQDGHFLGEHPSPVHTDFADPPDDPVLTGLELAGIGCAMEVASLVVMTPYEASTHTERVACGNPLREPWLGDRWGHTATGRVQAFSGSGSTVIVEGSGQVSVECSAGEAVVQAPGTAALSCSDWVEVSGDATGVWLDEACTPWPDLEVWTPPVTRTPDVMQLELPRSTTVWADGSRGPDVTFVLEDDALVLQTEGELTSLRVNEWVGSSARVPLDELDLGPHTPELWRVQVVLGSGEATLAPRLLDGPLSWAPLWVPRAWDPEPVEWEPSERPSSWVLWSDEDWPVGVSGVSVVNPHPNEVEGLIEDAGDISLELFNFELNRGWSNGAERDRYDELAQVIDGRVPWGLVDEPLYSSLLICRDEVAADPGVAGPELAEELAVRGCVEACDTTQAWLACIAAFPAVMESLAEQGGDVRINLTPDGAVLWDDLPGTLSLTNNWVGAHRMTRRRQVFHDQLAAREGDFIGYTVLVGPTREHAWAGPPTPEDWHGHSWELLQRGAIGLRHLAWPPDPSLEEVFFELQDELERLPLDGERAQLRAWPPEVMATAWRDGDEQVVVVTNPTDRDVEARIEGPNGLIEVDVGPFAAQVIE